MSSWGVVREVGVDSGLFGPRREGAGGDEGSSKGEEGAKEAEEGIVDPI
jgi:hypothetical protein